MKHLADDKNNWILVTGGTGFVGFALIKKLITSGYRVKTISRRSIHDKEFDDLLRKTPRSQLQLIKADLTDLNKSAEVFEEVKYVFHCAALLNSVLPYQDFYESNVVSTKNICDLCLKHEVIKLIYISSADVFGIPKHGETFNERSPYKPWSEPYPDTKIRASNLTKAYQKKGLNITTIYPGWVFGPGDKNLVPSISKQLRSGLTFYWDRNRFNIGFVYIDDLMDILMEAWKNPMADHEGFIALDDQSDITLSEFCRLIGEVLGIKFKSFPIPYSLAYIVGWVSQLLYQKGITKSLIMSTTDVKSFGHAFKFDTKKAQEVLGWKPSISVAEGMTRWKQWADIYLKKND